MPAQPEQRLLPIQLPTEYLDVARRELPFLDGGSSRYSMPFDPNEFGSALKVVAVAADFTTIAMLPTTVRMVVRHFVGWATRKHARFELELTSPRGSVKFSVDDSADAAAIANSVVERLFPQLDGEADDQRQVGA